MSELDKVHPFEPFPGTDAANFIQWKGTDLCMDFYCPCGTHSHFDGMFCYYLACRGCGAIYQLGTQVKARRLDIGEESDIEPAVGLT